MKCEILSHHHCTYRKKSMSHRNPPTSKWQILNVRKSQNLARVFWIYSLCLLISIYVSYLRNKTIHNRANHMQDVVANLMSVDKFSRMRQKIGKQDNRRWNMALIVCIGFQRKRSWFFTVYSRRRTVFWPFSTVGMMVLDIGTVARSRSSCDLTFLRLIFY